MRKRGWFAIVLVLCLLLAGCGNSSANTASETDKDSQTEVSERSSDSGLQELGTDH